MPRFNIRLFRNPISFAGAALTTLSAVLFLVVFLADLFGLHTNPYIGIVFFLILPGVFLIGLVLVPLGAWRERRRQARGHAETETAWPRFDFNDPIQRRAAAIFFAMTLANIVIVALASYRGVEYMDSVGFCGQTCHTVMKPEFMAYQDQPHSHVACVECHVGSGATSFAKAKYAGIRRVYAVATGSYSRPIPPPIRALRPARDTCEHCHWSEKFHGDKIRRIAEYAEDEKNTESVTTLQVHVGGGSQRLGIAEGIHWHMNLANEVEFIATDADRNVIPWVRVKDQFGAVREYSVKSVTPEQLAKGERRRMDCMDCHNRPSHPIAATPERAVNERMARGGLSKTLPFVRRETVKALKASYPTEGEAERGIADSLRGFYRSLPAASSSNAQDVDQAIRATVDIYRRNVFPEMNVQFGTYATNIGHIDFPGCFRCHDDDHKSKDGKAIGQDCETCHHIE